MQRCSRCHVNIRGYKRACPLCGGPLTGEPEEDVYPMVRGRKVSRLTVVKTAAFALLAFFAAMVVLRTFLGGWATWAPLAMICAVIGFIDIYFIIYFRSNPLKTVTWQIYIGMVVSIVVDHFTGRHGWAVTWVVPAGFLGLMIATAAIGAGLHMYLVDYVLYLLFDAIVSTAAQDLTLLLYDYPFRYPMVISFFACILFFLAVLIFRWKDFKSAGSRYFAM